MNAQPPTSVRTYSAVFGALLVLLALSIGVARVELGGFNLFVALSFSVAKAVLIMIFFMHLNKSTALIRLVAAGGFLWLAILFVVMVGEFETRSRDTQPAVLDRPTLNKTPSFNP